MMIIHAPSLKLYIKIILLFLCVVHGNFLLPSEEYLAHHNKIACNFVSNLECDFMQNFSSKTLAQAGEQYWELEPITRRMIWHKINPELKLNKNKNPHFAVAFGLISATPAQQYKVLSGDSDVKGEMFPESMPIPVREHILKMLKTKTIGQLCTSETDINKIFGNQKTILLKYNDDRVKEAMEVTKAEFFGLTNAHMEAIKKMLDSYVMEPWSRKSELCLFNELPPSVQEKFKPCVGRSKKHSQPYYDIRIKFYYHYKRTPELIIKSALSGIRAYLPVAAMLLYCHNMLEPAWMDYTEIQNPALLELNVKKELTNSMIPQDLIKHTIVLVPFETDWKGYGRFWGMSPGTLLPFTLFPNGFTEFIHRVSKQAIGGCYYCKFQNLRCTAHEGFFWSCIMENLLYRGCKLWPWILFTAITAPIATCCSQVIFAGGVPKGLMFMGTFATLMGLKNGLRPQLGIIDFKKGGSVEKLLNNPDIEICETEKETYFWRYDGTKACI